MTDAAFEAGLTRQAARRPGNFARLMQALAGWITGLGEETDADPTAGFSSREWADLPVHHPRDER